MGEIDMAGIKINQRPAPVMRSLNPERVLEKKISISMRSVFFVFVIALVVSGSFFAGRYLFPSDSFKWGTAFASFSGSDIEPEADLTAAAEKAVPEIEEEIEVIPDPEEAVEETVVEAVVEAVEEVEESSEPESIVTEYSDIVLSFQKTPVYEWKETWGKLKTIYYTIENNEEGTIKPATFQVLIEGYASTDTGVKTIDVPTVDSEIRSGELTSHGIDITGGSYTEKAPDGIIDPTNMEITIRVLDEEGVIMATAKERFNLAE
jgi:hypothetical protein